MEKVLNRGDVILISFPFTDLTSMKVRPTIVISSDLLNRSSQDITVSFISSVIPSQIESTDFLITSSESDFQITGLKKNSVFKMAKIVTLSKNLVQRKIGKVSDRIKRELDNRLKEALGLYMQSRKEEKINQMDELMTELARKMTDQLEKFLIACKEASDVTIDDVLRRLEELEKET